MNERMRELEFEAIEYTNSVTPANIRYNDIYYDVIRGKFAELIVKECLNATRGAVTGLDAFNSIKQHFGVEE